MLTHCVVAEGGVYVRFLDNGDEIAIRFGLRRMQNST
jgi:hypothetical protein